MYNMNIRSQEFNNLFSLNVMLWRFSFSRIFLKSLMTFSWQQVVVGQLQGWQLQIT